jgi:DNA-binding GntR family transcriptional regulator
MSEMPVRDALRLLEAEQLVTVTARRGARVTELSAEDIEELYAMRAGLEGLAARLAVARMDDSVARAVEELFKVMVADQAAGDTEAFMLHDREFHRTLYEAAGRPRLVQRIQGLWNNSRRSLPLVYRSWLPATAALESHRIILAAVLARNPDAAQRFTREHTEQAARRIVDSLTDEHSGHSKRQGRRTRRVHRRATVDH